MLESLSYQVIGGIMVLEGRKGLPMMVETKEV